MSPESLLALAVLYAPDFDSFVPRPRDELPRIRRVELELTLLTVLIILRIPLTAPRPSH
jgi:hypothetical protein